jgi:predicted PurR-regulated permease PerM
MNEYALPGQAASQPRLPFSKRVLIAGGILIALGGLVLFVWFAVQVLLLIFAGVLLAILLRSAADWLGARTGFSAGTSLAVVLLLILVALSAFGWAVAPQVAEQVEQLTVTVPEAFAKLQERVQQYPWGRRLFTGGLDPLSPQSPDILARATGALSTTAAVLIGAGVILFVGVYLAIRPDLYTDGILRLFPIRKRPRAREVLGAIGYTLRWWLIGQAIAMACVGLLTTPGLWLLGVPLALALGLLAAVLDFVPNIGPVLAAAPGVLLALVDSPTKAMYVTAMYMVVQQIESFIVTPLVHQRTVLMPPVLTISAQLLLGILIGPLGLLLATPLTAVALVLVKMLYVEDTLGDRVDTPDDHMDPESLPPLPTPHDGSPDQEAPRKAA